MKTHSALPLILALGLFCPLMPAQEAGKQPVPAEAPAVKMETEKWTDIPASAFENKDADEDAFFSAHDPEKILRDAGIRFPEGASARYSVGKRTLTVTNTPEELAKIDAAPAPPFIRTGNAAFQACLSRVLCYTAPHLPASATPYPTPSMLTVNGKYGTASIMTDAIDSASWDFLHRVMSAGVAEGSRIVIMPDCHAGSSCVIGYTQKLNPADPRICPNIIGVDIGCTISSLRLGLPEERLTEEMLRKLDAHIRASVGVGVGEYSPRRLSREEKMLISAEDLAAFAAAERLIEEDGRHGSPMNRPILAQLKSIGGGNHFIELGRDSGGACWLTVHSGSREFGKTVAKIYQKHAVECCTDRCEPGLRYLTPGSPYYAHYLEAVDACQRFARLNHALVLADIARFLQGGNSRQRVSPTCCTMHNYIDLENMVVRKGAVRAAAGERLLIPFNMRDGIALCTGKGHAEWNDSAPHGAGRLMTRAEAKAALDPAQAKAEMAAHGVFSTSLDYCLDETAGAYKPMQEIMERIRPTVEVQDLIRPLYNIKGKS